MLAVFDPLRDINFLTTLVRLCLAVACGGLIGIEREYKRRPAGLRTHVLLCLGAAVTTLTSEYLLVVMGYHTDIARLGAQVVAGVGFIGAGTILVTRHQKVKGLTTAAGLWASAIIGLALGAGFYEGAIIATIAVLLSEFVLNWLEYQMVLTGHEVSLYIEYKGAAALERIIDFLQEAEIKLLDMETIHLSAAASSKQMAAIVTLRLDKNHNVEELMRILYKIKGLALVEEI